MNATSTLIMDDDEISLHLVDSDPALRSIGLEAAMERYRLPLLRRVHGYGITDHHEASEVVADAFLEIHHRGQQGTLNLKLKLVTLLFTVARNKAIDILRKRKVRLPSSDCYTATIKDKLNESDAILEWGALRRRGKAQEILDDFLCDLGLMTRLQREVAHALALLFSTNSAINDTNLRDAVAQLTGRPPPPLPSVKTAWSAVRKKLKERIQADL